MDGVATLARRKAWAQQEFGGAQLGDARRTRRLVTLAAQMAGNSSGTIPQQTGCAADMKAAYRLFAAERVTHAAILAPHLQQTRERASRLERLFLVQDTAQLNFTRHAHCTGLGPMGRGDMRGLHQQNVLAVDPLQRRPLGLMYQALLRRTERGAGHDSAAKRRVPLDERESHWWVQAIRMLGPPPPRVSWVHVGDRGEDIFGVYDECRRQNADWLIRAAHDRAVHTASGANRLMSYARSLPARTSRRLSVRSQSSGTPREVDLSVAAGALTILPSQNEPEYQGREPVACWVVRAWEAHPPAEAPPLEWILLTSLPGDTAEQMHFVAQGYSLRWLIEEFHKCEKTGCNVELRRLEHTDRLEPLIGLLSVLAVWLLMLKFAARDEPDQLATALFDDATVRLMGRYLKRPADGLTVADFWRGIGRLGGHMGRKSDGPVGWLRAWRGWQSFQLIRLGAELAGQDG
jgi:hypothetical protein